MADDITGGMTATAAPAAATEAPASTSPAVDGGSGSSTSDALAHIESIQKELGFTEPKFTDFTRTVHDDGSESWVPDGVEAEDATSGSTTEESDKLPEDEIRAIFERAGLDPSVLDNNPDDNAINSKILEYETKLKGEAEARTKAETELFKRQKAEALQRGDLFFGEPQEFKQIYSSTVEPKITGFANSVPEVVSGIIHEGLTEKFNALVKADNFTMETMQAAVAEFEKNLSSDVQNMVKAIALGSSVESLKGLHGEMGKKASAQAFNQQVQTLWHTEFSEIAGKLAQAGVPMTQEIANQATELLNDLILAGKGPEDAVNKASSYAKSLVSTAMRAGQQAATLSNTARAAATVAATGGHQVPVENPQADLLRKMSDPNVPLSEIENFAKGA